AQRVRGVDQAVERVVGVSCLATQGVRATHYIPVTVVRDLGRLSQGIRRLDQSVQPVVRQRGRTPQVIGRAGVVAHPIVGVLLRELRLQGLLIGRGELRD